MTSNYVEIVMKIIFHQHEGQEVNCVHPHFGIPYPEVAHQGVDVDDKVISQLGARLGSAYLTEHLQVAQLFGGGLVGSLILFQDCLQHVFGLKQTAILFKLQYLGMVDAIYHKNECNHAKNPWLSLGKLSRLFWVVFFLVS